MQAATPLGAPYRAPPFVPPPPQRPRTRRWFVALGALFAAGLAQSPRLLPEVQRVNTEARTTLIPYWPVRYPEELVEPLRDVVGFAPSSEGLLAVQRDGDGFLICEAEDGASLEVARPGPIEQQPFTLPSVRGVVRFDGSDSIGPSCLLGEGVAECSSGMVTPHADFSDFHSARCRLDGDGLVRCQHGLASGHLRNRSRPAPITSSQRFRSIAAGGAQTCGVTFEGRVSCWGPSLQPVQALSHVTSVALRDSLGCSLRTDGSVWCWPTPTRIATPVVGLPNTVSIAANATATCALDASGIVLCWGVIGRAWPGHARVYRARRPLDVRLPEPATVLYGGLGDTFCARLRSGAMRCWGGSLDPWRESVPTEQLGDVPSDESWDPSAPGASGVDATEGARRLEDGRVIVRDSAAPRGWSVLADLPRTTMLTAGLNHACALASDGRAWCWGSNEQGQLGLDDNVDPNAWTVVQVRRY